MLIIFIANVSITCGIIEVIKYRLSREFFIVDRFLM